MHLRDRSWRLRCSLRLKARLQNWHLYFFSGAPVLRVAGDELDAITTIQICSRQLQQAQADARG
jgi:hypothetical protein